LLGINGRRETHPPMVVNDEAMADQGWSNVIASVAWDGRQLDGWMVPFEYGFECERVVFEPWQIGQRFPR
jgi:hypothetical protein